MSSDNPTPSCKYGYSEADMDAVVGPLGTSERLRFERWIWGQPSRSATDALTTTTGASTCRPAAGRTAASSTPRTFAASLMEGRSLTNPVVPVGSSVPGNTPEPAHEPANLWNGDDAISEVEVRMCDRCHNLGDRPWENKRVVHALLHDRTQALAAKDRLLLRIQQTQILKGGPR